MREESAKLTALRGAAKLGLDAIERGGRLALRSDQDIAGFVQQAGLKAKATASALVKKSV